jgi:hypothetical protein
MATKKKTKKKSTRLKKSNARKSPAKKQAPKGRTPAKSVKKKAAPNTTAKKSKVLKKTTSGKTGSGIKRKRPDESQLPDSLPSSTEFSGLQSGDLQGLSSVESADSESVDELMEEGNAFEAGVVAGVEDSEGRDEEEVRTREVPEDDVPGEYLDEE